LHGLVFQLRIQILHSERELLFGIAYSFFKSCVPVCSDTAVSSEIRSSTSISNSASNLNRLQAAIQNNAASRSSLLHQIRVLANSKIRFEKPARRFSYGR
jgi:hypothetical protein